MSSSEAGLACSLLLVVARLDRATKTVVRNSPRVLAPRSSRGARKGRSATARHGRAVKLSAGQVEAFIARPKPEVATVLLYGPDAGLVAERARRLGTMVAGSLNDPFQVSELDPDLLEREPHRLVEEAQALCLMGGRRLVRVRNATDRVTDACRQLVAVENQAGFVVIEAGDLGASKLRRLIEGARTAAALPCYRADERGLSTYVRETLGELGLRAEPEAFAYSPPTSAATRASPGPSSRSSSSTCTIGPAVPSGSRTRPPSSATARPSRPTTSSAPPWPASGPASTAPSTASSPKARHPRACLRACTRTLTQMLRLRADMAGGKPGLPMNLPPAQRTFLERHLRAWPPDRILAALGRLQEAEIRCRATGAPQALVCREVLAGLAGTGLLRREPLLPVQADRPAPAALARRLEQDRVVVPRHQQLGPGLVGIDAAAEDLAVVEPGLGHQRQLDPLGLDPTATLPGVLRPGGARHEVVALLPVEHLEPERAAVRPPASPPPSGATARVP